MDGNIRQSEFLDNIRAYRNGSWLLPNTIVLFVIAKPVRRLVVEISFLRRGFPRQFANWLGMTFSLSTMALGYCQDPFFVILQWLPPEQVRCNWGLPHRSRCRQDHRRSCDLSCRWQQIPALCRSRCISLPACPLQCRWHWSRSANLRGYDCR